MPGPSPLSNESIAGSTSEPLEAQSADSAHRGEFAALGPPVRFVGFWSAIALPFVHVPMLLQGLASPEQTLVFLTLLVSNVFALYVGHGYKRN